MYEINGQKQALTTFQTFYFFCAGLLFNAVGNGLTVATNMGSAPWTASAANLSLATGQSISIFLLLYGFAAACLTAVIIHHLDWGRFFGNMLFVILFSYIIGYVNHFFVSLGIMSLPFWIRIIIDIIAIIFVGIGVSISQRLQLVLHPLDDLVVITRFKYFHGDARISQLVNFATPMIISLLVWIITRQLVALNVGTLISFFGQGIIIQFADKAVFKHLIHRKEMF